PDALGLARENAVGHAVADRISFAEADLLPPDARGFDVILANLPYVRHDAMANDGVAMFEIGADQGDAIVALVGAKLTGWSCVVELDLAGLPRVARIA